LLQTCPLIVLRPYGPRIREPIFTALRELEFEPDADAIIDERVSDDEICEQLTAVRPNVLLCPFNAVRLRDGSTTNGLRLLLRLMRDPRLTHLHSVPVLMPVSMFSAVVFRLEWRRGIAEGVISSELRARTLILEEQKQQPTAVIARRIRAHLRQFRDLQV